MKTLQKTLLALAATSLVSVGAQAAVAYGNGYTGTPYVGVKVGQFDLDVDGADKPTAYGVYGTYRYFVPNTALYGKAKLGIARTEIEGDFTDVINNVTVRRNSYSDSDTTLAGGLGIGYAVNPDFGIEAEYDIVGSDANLMTIGAHLKF